MVHACSVIGCINRQRKDSKSKRSFHSFPFNDPDRLIKWISRISRLDGDGKAWKPTKHSKVCSDHFVPGDYEIDTQRKMLRNTAVPSLFPSYPRHKQPTTTTHRKLPKIRPFKVDVGPTSNNQVDSISKKCARVIMDHCYISQPVDTKTELENLRDNLEKAKAIIKEKERAIKCLRQKLKRRNATISSLASGMENL